MKDLLNFEISIEMIKQNGLNVIIVKVSIIELGVV